MDDDAYNDMLELAKNHREALRKPRPKAPPSEDAWPRDQSGWTFLARAIQQLGALRFGTAWTGREGKPFSRLPLPNFSDSKSPRFLEARRNAHRILMGHPDYVAHPIEPTPSQGPDFAFSDVMWAVAQAHRQESIRSGIAGLARRRSVLDELRQALHQGTIKAGARALLDEGIEELPPEIWHNIDSSAAAEHFQIDLNVITSSEICRGLRWLFVSSDDLQAVCRAAEKDVSRSVAANVSRKPAQEAIGHAGRRRKGRPSSRICIVQEANRLLASKAVRFFSRQDLAEHLERWCKSGPRPHPTADTIAGWEPIKQIFNEMDAVGIASEN